MVGERPFLLSGSRPRPAPRSEGHRPAFAGPPAWVMHPLQPSSEGALRPRLASIDRDPQDQDWVAREQGLGEPLDRYHLGDPHLVPNTLQLEGPPPGPQHATTRGTPTRGTPTRSSRRRQNPPQWSSWTLALQQQYFNTRLFLPELGAAGTGSHCSVEMQKHNLCLHDQDVQKLYYS